MAAPSLKVQLQGQTSVSADNLNTFAQTCDTVAELRGFVGITGMEVLIRGLTAPNDGGAGSFYWDSAATGPDNGVSVIVPTGSASGAWIRLLISGVNGLPIYSFVTTSALLTAFATPIILSDGTIALTTGRTTEGDGGGAEFYYKAGDTTSADNGGTIRVDAAGRRWYALGDITLELFGGSPATVDNSVPFAAMAAAVVTLNQFTYCFIKSKGNLPFLSGITIDVSRMGLVGNGNFLDFRALNSSGIGVTITSSNPFTNNSAPNARTAIEKLGIWGPSLAGTNTGIKIVYTTDVAFFVIRDVAIFGWNYGESFGTNAYLVKHEHVNIYENVNGIVWFSGATDAGENISYVDCAIFDNSGIGIVLEGGGDWNFVTTSIDSNNTGTGEQIFVQDTEAHFWGCHIEGSAQAAFQVNNSVATGRINFTDTTFVQQSSSVASGFMLINSGGFAQIVGGAIVIADSASSPVIIVASGGALATIGVNMQYSGATFVQNGGSWTNIPILGASGYQALIAGTLQSNGFIGPNLTFNQSISLVTVNTWYPLETGIGGAFFFSDDTSGGKAQFNADATAVTSVTNEITDFAAQWASGGLQISVTGGTTPRTIVYGYIILP